MSARNTETPGGPCGEEREFAQVHELYYVPKLAAAIPTCAPYPYRILIANRALQKPRPTRASLRPPR